MDLSYQTEDYGQSSPVSSKKLKMKTVYPQVELRGKAAQKFFEEHPSPKLDTIFCSDKMKLVGMKKGDGKNASEYDNCVTFEVMSLESSSAMMDDEGMPKD